MLAQRRTPEEARRAYVTDRVMSADPVERVCICFEEVCLRLDQATALLRERDEEQTDRLRRISLAGEAHTALMKAHAFISELQVTLDVSNEDPEVRRHGEELRALYAAMLETIVAADTAKSVPLVERVLKVARERLAYWREVHALFLEESARQAAGTETEAKTA